MKYPPLRLLALLICIAFSATVWAQMRTEAEAMAIAQKYMQERPLRTGGRRMAPASERPMIVASRLILNNTSGNDAFFVVNYKRSGCFAIVAADKRMGDVLAYSDTHTLDTEHIAPQLREFLAGYADQARALGTCVYLGKRKNTDELDVPYMIQTQWSQRMPYNTMCPKIGTQNALTGCVATMMAQLMYFHRYPTMCNGNITYTTTDYQINLTVDYDSYTPDWDHMLPTYSSAYEEQEVWAVSTLMFMCGASVKTNYSLSESSSTLEAVPHALITYFGYDRDIVTADSRQMADSDFHRLLQAELMEGRPVACGGNNEYGGGHAFLIDGIAYDITGATDITDVTDAPFYHFNLGWAGLDDGYFRFPDIEYNRSNRILLYVQPDNDSTECVAFLQATSIEPTLKKMNLKMFNTMPIKINNLYNAKQEDFIGTGMVFVVDSTGREELVGTTDIIQKVPDDPSYKYMSTYKINAILPDTLANGEYSVKFRVRAAGSDSLIDVYTATTHTFTITDEDVSLTPQLEVTTIKVNSQACNDTTVSVSLSELTNFGGVAFKGDIALAIATEDSTVCMLDGMYNFSSELKYLKIRAQSITIVGSLQDSIADGEYKIIVLARQAGFDNWGRIKLYEHDSYNQITQRDMDLSIPCVITDNCISIDSSFMPTTYAAKLVIEALNVDTDASHAGNVKISIGAPINIDSQQFTGEYSMAIIDSNNQVIEVFGSTASEKDLSVLRLRSKTFTFTGEIPATLPDGRYSICIAACVDGYTNWTPLSGYTLEQPNTLHLTNDIPTLGFEISNGKIRLDTDSDEPTDVNRDGTTDTQDVLAVYSFMQESGGEPATEDVNRDGMVDTQDVLSIYQYMQDN